MALEGPKSGYGPRRCLGELDYENEQHVEFLDALRAHFKQPLLINRHGLQGPRSKLARTVRGVHWGATSR
jgi:hypothetical protein